MTAVLTILAFLTSNDTMNTNDTVCTLGGFEVYTSSANDNYTFAFDVCLHTHYIGAE